MTNQVQESGQKDVLVLAQNESFTQLPHISGGR